MASLRFTVRLILVSLWTNIFKRLLASFFWLPSLAARELAMEQGEASLSLSHLTNNEARTPHYIGHTLHTHLHFSQSKYHLHKRSGN